ncbi:DUF433 domain-containing protein [Allokutzneria albata]|uniref:Homeodomain-like domain-containing protein n=1 Tax=Allokutzneria albata TaxID=211114 RepID=A0A1H0C334_ALLAB|nr:DUF433 domain-containing protein [Allokutzneria albata]SDN52252.1 Homeodomain-like domain-containing protein [Allokutzneria albata]
MTDIRFSAGLMGMSDAARHLGIPRRTFQRWARGYERGGPLLHLVPTERKYDASVTFISLVEAWVLAGLRKAGVVPQRIRPALQRLQQEFGREYVLTSRELATDGIAVLWDFSRTNEGEGLIEGRTDQLIIREIVADYMHYVGWADDGHPSKLELRTYQPSKVTVDPYRGFGQPMFAGNGVHVANVAAMLKAGEEPDIVAEEHGISIEDVRAAARVLLGRAA